MKVAYCGHWTFPRDTADPAIERSLGPLAQQNGAKSLVPRGKRPLG